MGEPRRSGPDRPNGVAAISLFQLGDAVIEDHRARRIDAALDLSRMSLLWLPSPRICRRSLDYHPLTLCGERSVGLAYRASGLADQSCPFLNKRPSDRLQQPTFETKSARGRLLVLHSRPCDRDAE